jgi:cytoskeletal protein RodZ
MVNFIKHKQKGFVIIRLAGLVIILLFVFAVLGSKGKPGSNTNAGLNKTNSVADISVSDINKDSSQNQANKSDQVLNVESETHIGGNISEFDNKTSSPAPPVVSDKNTLTDPNKKPTYDNSQTNVDGNSGQPKNGDKKDGYVYILGFGWVKDDGGGASGVVVDGNGDINKQVGNMG